MTHRTAKVPASSYKGPREQELPPATMTGLVVYRSFTTPTAARFMPKQRELQHSLHGGEAGRVMYSHAHAVKRHFNGW